MSFTGVFGLVMLAIAAIALLGPSKLPAGMEQLWLMLGNLRRSQAGVPPLTIEQARRSWQLSGNPVYDLIQVMYGAVEHLIELRKRLFIVFGALAVGAVIAGIFANDILTFLKAPAPDDVQLVVLRPTDMVWVYMEVIFSVAAVVALPVFVYQALLFVRPALETPEEVRVFKGIAIVGLPMLAIFFIIGMTFAYYVMLPFGLSYLFGFGTDIAQPAWEIRGYMSFVLAVMLWIGAAFETPLIMALLSRLGLVSPQAMGKQWRYAILGVAVVAAAITPTVDPVNMALVMGPLLVLYLLGVLMARAVYPRNKAKQIASSEQPTA